MSKATSPVGRIHVLMFRKPDGVSQFNANHFYQSTNYPPDDTQFPDNAKGYQFFWVFFFFFKAKHISFPIACRGLTTGQVNGNIQTVTYQLNLETSKKLLLIASPDLVHFKESFLCFFNRKIYVLSFPNRKIYIIEQPAAGRSEMAMNSDERLLFLEAKMQ